MPLVATRELVDRAVAHHLAVGAFNIITLEHAEAVVEGAERVDTPVILQISENAVRFHHGGWARSPRPRRRSPSAPPCRWRCTWTTWRTTTSSAGAAGLGISSVMYDASKLDYDKNVEATRAAREWAHANGLYLEAELGEVGGKDGAHAPGVRTDPVRRRSSSPPRGSTRWPWPWAARTP